MFGTISSISHTPYTLMSTFQTKQADFAQPYSVTPSETSAIPVQPVPAAREVISNDAKFSVESLLNQYASDPASMAIRMRIQPYSAQDSASSESLLKDIENVEKSKSPLEVVEESTCQTCQERKYQDGSDDPGVSFKSPTQLTPEEAATAVRGHEMEHVVRNQAKAAREDREIVSQSIVIHTDICPECGRVYTSGGTTTTVTKGNSTPNPSQENSQPDGSFFAVA